MAYIHPEIMENAENGVPYNDILNVFQKNISTETHYSMHSPILEDLNGFA